METPPTRGNGMTRLQRQLDAASGQRLHRRGVSRNIQIEDTFYTPTTSPRQAQSVPRQNHHDSPVTRSDNTAQQIIPPIDKASPSLSPRGVAGFANLGGPGGINSGSNSAGSPHITKQPSAAGGARALSSRRLCFKCHGDINGHFVRALDNTYHIDCFTCEDCNTPCASKFFPSEGKPLCERCYFKRQNLLCYRCNNSLRGSYITALDRKYHVDHFTCSLCTTVFGPEDSYFEYNGDVYCRAHYSSLFAFRCEGCKSPILKQFVETYRSGRQQQWHPECYMIFKFWSVKVADPQASEVSQLRAEIARASDPKTPLDSRAARVIAHEEMIDKRTMRTWTTLCGFEEACAESISLLVQYAYTGDFKGAHKTCSKLVSQIKVLFTALDAIPSVASTGSISSSRNVSPAASSGSVSSSKPDKHKHDYKEPGREAKTLCRKVVSYMSLLSKTRQKSHQERVQGLASDLLSLASAMSHYLKVLIRQGLSGALSAQLLDQFLSSIGLYSSAKPAKSVSPFTTDRCMACNKAVEDQCYRQRERSDRLWHAKPECFRCTQSGVVLDPNNAALTPEGKLVTLEVDRSLPRAHFSIITKLEQYVILLHVALARLNLVLSNHRRPKSQESSPNPESAVSNSSASTPTLPGEISISKAITAKGVTNGSGIISNFDAPVALERTSRILHQKAGLTLDDIRRIVAAEQARSTTKAAAEKTQAEPALTANISGGSSNGGTNNGDTNNGTIGSNGGGSSGGAISSVSSSPQVSEKSEQPPTMTTTRASGVYYGKLSDNAYAWAICLAQALLQPYAKRNMKANEFENFNSAVAYSNISGNGSASSSASNPASKQGTIWERMGKVFAIKEQDTRVFGQPLDRLVAKYGVDSNLASTIAADGDPNSRYSLKIPSFVDDCISAMRQKDMSVEGIFRKNGNIRRIREFVEKIDRNQDETGLLVEESPIQLAALLKKFLRDLPDPVMTARLTPLWSTVPALEDPQQRIRVCQLLIAILPRPNRSLLEILVYFLNWVASFAHVDDESGSKMDISNLATVLGPTLAISREEAAAHGTAMGASTTLPDGANGTNGSGGGASNANASSGSSSYKSVSEAIKLLISDYNIVSQVPNDIAAALKQLNGAPRRLTLQEANRILAGKTL